MTKRRPKTGRKYKRSKGNLAQKAYRLAKNLNKGREMHKLDVVANSLFAGNDTVAQLLTATAEDVTSQGRVGLKIYGRSLRFHYEVVWGALATQVQHVCRIIIVQDKQQNGIRPTIAQLLEGPASNTYATIALRQNTTEGKRFKFLYDAVHRPPRQVIGDTYSTGRKVTLPIKANIYYTASSGAEASLAKNNVYLFLISDLNSGTDAPTVRWTSRFYFDA